MAEASEILNTIHKSDPPPKGKINKETKTENRLKISDATLIDEDYNAAKFLYTLIIQCFKIKGKPLYNPKDNTTEETFESMIYKSAKKLMEADEESEDTNEPKEDIAKGTKQDEKYKNFAISLVNVSTDFVYATNILKAFAFDVDKTIDKSTKGQNGEEITLIKSGGTVGKLFGTIKGKEEQTAFIRSANHYLAVTTGKTDFYFDGITKLEGYNDFKKVFPDVASNYEHRHFNSDVNTGVDPYVINAFISLLNSSIKIMNVDGTDKGKFNIKQIPIPKDNVDPDKEAVIKSAQKKVEVKINSVARKLILAAVNLFLKKENVSITGLANVLRESVAKIDDKWIAKVSEQNPEFQGKTFAMLNQEWKSDHFKQMDSRDAQELQNLNNAVGSDGANFKRYWDSLDETGRTNLLDTLSRQLYLVTDGKTMLVDWDDDLDNLCYLGCSEFKAFVNGPENGNRYTDDDDLEDYNTNRSKSNLDNLVNILKSIENGTAKDEDGNLIVNPDEFIKKYPSMADDKELERVVKLIATATPEEETELSEELGSAYIPYDTVKVFSTFIPDLKNQIETNKINLYHKINVLLGNGEKTKPISCSGNEDLFKNAKATIKEADVVYDINGFGKVKFSKSDLKNFMNINDPSELSFIKIMSKAKMNALNDISDVLSFQNVASNRKAVAIELQKIRDDFNKNYESLKQSFDNDIESLSNSFFANPEQPTDDEMKAYEEELSKKQNESITKEDELFKPVIEKINELLANNGIQYKMITKSFNDKISLEEDSSNLKDILAGKEVKGQEKSSDNSENNNNNGEGSSNLEGSDNVENSSENVEPNGSGNNEQQTESIRNFAEYLKKFLG